MKASIVHSSIGPRSLKQFTVAQDQIEPAVRDLRAIGINISNGALRQMVTAYAMDAGNDVGINPPTLPGLLTDSTVAPLQFLQQWLPGFVYTLTAAQMIDELIGISTVGSFEDEEVVQGTLEPRGTAMPYVDGGNIPFTSWQPSWERRTVVRMESGFELGYLEDLRASRARINSAATKRTSSASALEIQRNRIGFYGYNNGQNRTYGFLNDPALPAYNTVPNGAGGTSPWAGKTFQEITKDLRVAFAGLRTQSKGRIDPKKTPITVAVALSAVDTLTYTTDFGMSVMDWLNKSYPNVRVESAPELDAANGGANVAYYFAESVDDGVSDDDKRTFVQIVPAKFQAIGVEKRAKSSVEDFANATAGVMCKRPYAVYRQTGV